MSFWDSITDFADEAWSYVELGYDWLAGTDGGMGEDYGTPGALSTLYGYGESFLGSDLGDLVSSGAKYYLESQKKDGPFGQTQRQAPKITRAASTVNVAGLASLRNPVGVNNPDVRAAMQRLSQRTNINPDMQSISQQYMTKRQGARTMGLESSSLPRVRTAPAASVRTTSTQEVSLDG
jgi:hypothetical protein